VLELREGHLSKNCWRTKRTKRRPMWLEDMEISWAHAREIGESKGVDRWRGPIQCSNCWKKGHLIKELPENKEKAHVARSEEEESAGSPAAKAVRSHGNLAGARMRKRGIKRRSRSMARANPVLELPKEGPPEQELLENKEKAHVT